MIKNNKCRSIHCHSNQKNDVWNVSNIHIIKVQFSFEQAEYQEEEDHNKCAKWSQLSRTSRNSGFLADQLVVQIASISVEL